MINPILQTALQATSDYFSDDVALSNNLSQLSPEMASFTNTSQFCPLCIDWEFYYSDC